ncbi:hypothetical protein GWI33_009309 [Rhynchophorus ferrugineus]|uniref:Uncharacterized protein n=1 Tax=Rhynchophorus ferrugineus TaxID=354439 RepID=A0A834IFI6_RHYFE|nr:hypothetical protein GWI33_009309 [Rhynchophorus ferrugineus]
MKMKTTVREIISHSLIGEKIFPTVTFHPRIKIKEKKIHTYTQTNRTETVFNEPSTPIWDWTVRRLIKVSVPATARCKYDETKYRKRTRLETSKTISYPGATARKKWAAARLSKEKFSMWCAAETRFVSQRNTE